MHHPPLLHFSPSPPGWDKHITTLKVDRLHFMASYLQCYWKRFLVLICSPASRFLRAERMSLESQPPMIWRAVFEYCILQRASSQKWNQKCWHWAKDWFITLNFIRTGCVQKTFPLGNVDFLLPHLQASVLQNDFVKEKLQKYRHRLGNNIFHHWAVRQVQE